MNITCIAWQFEFLIETDAHVNTPSFLTRGRTLVKLHVHTFYSVAGFSRFLISQAGSAGYREPPTSGTSLGGSHAGPTQL